MDLKCYPCIAGRWNRAERPPGMQPEGAANQANDAVTILNGTALCATHATKSAEATPPDQPGGGWAFSV